jgi:hypothetical protein
MVLIAAFLALVMKSVFGGQVDVVCVMRTDVQLEMILGT